MYVSSSTPQRGFGRGRQNFQGPQPPPTIPNQPSPPQYLPTTLHSSTTTPSTRAGHRHGMTAQHSTTVQTRHDHRQMASREGMKLDNPVTYKTPGQSATVGQSIHHQFCLQSSSLPGQCPCRVVACPCRAMFRLE